MFGIGEGELAIILVFGFLLFGPDKLPQMGRTIGRAIRQFKETQEKMTAVVQTEIIDADDDDDDPLLDDADDDDESTETTAPAHKETFAERRARLAAEKAAAEGSSEGDESAAEGEASTEGSEQDGPATEDAVESEPEPEPAVRTTADLYARRPRKHKAVVDELAAELAAEEAEAAAATDDDAPKGGDE